MERGRGVPEGRDEKGGGGCRAVPGGCEVEKAGSGQPGRERLLMGPGGAWGGRNGRISGKVLQASHGTGAAMAPCAAACTGGSLRVSRPGGSAARRSWGLPALLPSRWSPPRPSPAPPEHPRAAAGEGTGLAPAAVGSGEPWPHRAPPELHLLPVSLCLPVPGGRAESPGVGKGRAFSA